MRCEMVSPASGYAGSCPDHPGKEKKKMDLRVILILAAEAAVALLLLKRSGVPVGFRTAVISILLLFLAFWIRASLLDYETTDYQWFLTKWVDYYRENGGFAGLKNSVGNYNIPYLYFLALFSRSSIRDLYLIKLLSIFFDVILAYACMRIVQKCGGSPLRSAVCFFVVLFLPTVILNGAKWGQCDSIYTAFALLGIELALGESTSGTIGTSTGATAKKRMKKQEPAPVHMSGTVQGMDQAGENSYGENSYEKKPERHTNCRSEKIKRERSAKQHSAHCVSFQEILSVICIAVSFSFKLQAVFIMPAYVILWIKKKYRITDIFLFPLTYLIMILPAVLLGRPIPDALLLYVDQAETVGTAMNYNSPSMTALIRNVTDPDRLSVLCICLAFAAVALILSAGLLFRGRLNNTGLVGLTLLLTLAVPFFLPHMHDRYFFPADCLTVAFACAMTVFSPREIPEQLLRTFSAVFMQFGSLICYLAYFTGYYLPLGNIYLTNDRGAVAVILCTGITIFCTCSECSRSPVRDGKTA